MKSDIKVPRIGRRHFIQSASLGTASLIIPRDLSANPSFRETGSSTYIPPSGKYSADSPVNLKLNIKPLFAQRIHDSAYGGPCRWDPMDIMTP